MKYISPPYLLVYTSAVFFIAIIFPPDLYEYFIGEYDLIYFDLKTILFYLICCFSFFIGYFSFPNINFNVKFYGDNTLRNFNFSLMLSFCMALIGAFLIYNALSSDDLIFDLLISANGAVIKDELSPDGFGGLFNIFFIAFYWHLYFSFCMGFNYNNEFQKRIIKIFLFISFILITLSSIVKLARGELLPFLVGIFIIHVSIFFKGNIKLNIKFFAAALKLGIFIFIIFSAFSILRGELDFYKIIADFIGYILASYNKLAFILNGKLVYPYGGTGVYFSSFLSFNGTLNGFFGISNYMSWPKYVDLWNSEFQAVASAGLNQYLIWPSALGYLFLDFGWGTGFVLIMYGWIYKIVWSLWLSKTSIGIILYPWFAFCLLFWFGTNYLLDTKLLVYFIVGLFLTLLNFLGKNYGTS